MAGEDGYVVLVTSEPIKGLPSHRVYGIYETAEDAWSALGRDLGIQTSKDVKREGFLGMGVLPLRKAETLQGESP